MTEPRIRVVIADDQRLFVHGMSMLIESQPDLDLVGTAGNGQEAVDLVAQARPDVVLMDIRMPVLDGLEAAFRITRVRGDEQAGPHVIVLTTFRQEQAVLGALRNGAAAFLTKDCAPNDVLDTIRAVYRGDQSVDAVRVLLAHATSTTRRPHPEETLAPLSPREREIFVLVAKGLRNGEIAASAFVSETTVKTHVSNILGKLGLQSRAQIVVLAYESGLVSP